MAMSEPAFQFDFALSFAGPNRALAEEIKDALNSKGLSVFYDRDFEHEMLGRDGSVYLRDIYSRKSRHCLVLLSEQYDQREWAQLERESIQSRELRGERGVLIPVLVDGHNPSWLPETRIYYDLRSRKLEELIQLLVRMRKAESDSPTKDEQVQGTAACYAIQVRDAEFVNQCRAHLTLALRDGFVRIRLGYPSTKTEAGSSLIQLGALELLEDHPTGSRGAKYRITTLGTQILQRLRQG